MADPPDKPPTRTAEQQAALEELLNKYQKALDVLLLRRFHDQVIADDVAQEVRRRILDTDFSTKENPRTFVFGIVRNVCRERFREFRREAKQDPIGEGEGEVDPKADEASGPEALVQQEQVLEAVANEFWRLPACLRRAFANKELRGLRNRDAAKRSGQTLSTFNRNLSAARKRLSKKLRHIFYQPRGGNSDET